MLGVRSQIWHAFESLINIFAHYTVDINSIDYIQGYTKEFTSIIHVWSVNRLRVFFNSIMHFSVEEILLIYK